MSVLLQAEVRFDQQGHLPIPLEIIPAMAFDNETSLVAKVENGRLILEKPQMVRERLNARFANIPAHASLADELIADRRREASLDGVS